MPSPSEISAQVAKELKGRRQLSRPAFAGGVLYLLGGITIAATSRTAPTVGLLQGLAPALRGEATPSVSPKTAYAKFISHHAFALVAGTTITAIAVVALALVLLLLLDASRFRRPETWSAARPLVLIGGISVPVLSLLHSVVLAITAHSFATGHDFTNHAVDRALLVAGTLGVSFFFAGLLAALVLAVGMGTVMMNSRRVGLLPRWLSVLGIFSGAFFLPFFTSSTIFQLITAFWMVTMGILFAGKWTNGDPPAWAAGEARPWPSQAELRAAKQAGQGAPALATAGADVPPPPRPEASGGSRKARRKRRARG
jgi:hypothetical protein